MTMMMKNFLTLFFLGFSSGAVQAQSHPSCTNYTKGDFGPTTIDSQDICKSACETAEGLSVGDYNMDPNSTCNCLNDAATANRKICTDNVAASSGATNSGTCGGLLLLVVVTWKMMV